MDNRHNGAPVWTEADTLAAHTVPGREALLSKISELRTEIGQLKEAVVSHAVVDQAIGVVISLAGLRPDQGFEVLKAVSQHTNRKLRQVSEQIVDWVHSERLDEEVRAALEAALDTARST